MKKINKKGFTLVELLLVIAIIGILAAVLFVSLGSQRERARVTAFKESVRSAVPAATICRDQNGDVIASAAADDPICNPDNGDLYVDIAACNGDGSFVTTAVTDGDQDDWLLTTICTRSNGDTCTANCDVSGCEFVESVAGACN